VNHIHFTPDTEIMQINARLDEKQVRAIDPALVMGFEIVHVGAVAVHVFTNRVPRTMHKECAVPIPLMTSRAASST